MLGVLEGVGLIRGASGAREGGIMGMGTKNLRACAQKGFGWPQKGLWGLGPQNLLT